MHVQIITHMRIALAKTWFYSVYRGLLKMGKPLNSKFFFNKRIEFEWKTI
jgi:hypothetical protein